MLLLCWKWFATRAASVLSWVKRDGHWKLVAAAMTAAILALTIHLYLASVQKVSVLKSDLAVSKSETVLVTKARDADTHAVATVATAKATAVQTEQEQRVVTTKALEAHPDWANEPVPSDIIDSLRD